MKSVFRYLCLGAAAALLVSGSAHAQLGGLTLSPSGDNQFAAVTQGIGPVRVTITYNSPDVHSPFGEDRTGKIWGTLVPFGPTNLGPYATCGNVCPWRGGANENTTFTTTHDIKVQGQPLPAGTYGLFFYADPVEWTIIFSKNSTSWGSFYYDPKEDALRIKAKPVKNEYNEYLTYAFFDRKPSSATAALLWENLRLPFTLSVDNVDQLYLEGIRKQLRSQMGFNWQNYQSAAYFCLTHKMALDDGLKWAKSAVNPPNGSENFVTISTLAQLEEANGQTEESKKTIAKALEMPAGVLDLHQFARTLLALGKKEEALQVYERNAKIHPDVWPVHAGLIRGYAAVGRNKEALEQAKLALAQAPNEANRQAIQALIRLLEEGKSLD
jgi:hypothetical protein